MKSYRDLRTALAEADWEKILPGLTAYAERKLCWRGWGIRVSRPSGNDIVNQAIERCLSGDRQWSFDSQCDDLEVFLKGVMKSLVHSAKKSAARQKLNLFVDNPRPPAVVVTSAVDPVVDDADDGDSEIMDAVATCADGDPDLEAYYVAVTEEETRGDVASHLSWPSTRISAARTKLQRRLIVQFPALFCGLKKRRAS
jgi:hypothetical protein